MNDTVTYSIAIEPDQSGLIGRECPQCERYFKVKSGTGLPGRPNCHCPYCDHVGDPDTFWTKEQVAYAQSVAMNKLTSAFLGQLKTLERKPDRNALVSIGITVTGNPTPIKYYVEHDLEQRVTCSACTLEYAIYGAFGCCPDCGIHNSAQIAGANLDLVLKMLDLATKEEEGIKSKLVKSALSDAVSCFDGFGREQCIGLSYKLSFQNIVAARDKLQKTEGCDIAAGLSATQWAFVYEQFQKRHLIAHKMGVIDEEYVQKTGADRALIGRQATVTIDDVRNLVSHLRLMVENLFNGIPH